MRGTWKITIWFGCSTTLPAETVMANWPSYTTLRSLTYLPLLTKSKQNSLAVRQVLTDSLNNVASDLSTFGYRSREVQTTVTTPPKLVSGQLAGKPNRGQLLREYANSPSRQCADMPTRGHPIRGQPICGPAESRKYQFVDKPTDSQANQ